MEMKQYAIQQQNNFHFHRVQSIFKLSYLSLFLKEFIYTSDHADGAFKQIFLIQDF